MLRGMKVLITGAGRGVGPAVAEVFAQEAGQMILCGRQSDNLDAVAAKCEMLPGACMHRPQVLVLDLSSQEGVDQLVKEVLKNGGVDVLVNNSVCMMPGNATEGNLDDFDRQMYMNLLGPMRLTRLLTPKMVDRGKGTIINVGSLGAIEPMAGLDAVYCASKHGLRGWSLSIYESLRETHVKVMLINAAFDLKPAAPGKAEAMNPDNSVKPADVAETCLLPFRVSAECVPAEATLRLAHRSTT